MKKFLSIIIFLVFVTSFSFAAVPTIAPHQTRVVTKKQQDRAIMELVVKMSVADYEKYTGRKLNFINRFIFKYEKKRFESMLKRADENKAGPNILAFSIGLFFFPIGVLLIYLFSRDKNFRKWAWIGTAVAAFAFLLILLLAIAVGN